MTNPHTSMQKPATWYDFGLTPDEEARASQLHDELIVFDSLMECGIAGRLLMQAKDKVLCRKRSVSCQLIYRIQSVEILIDESVNH